MVGEQFQLLDSTNMVDSRKVVSHRSPLVIVSSDIDPNLTSDVCVLSSEFICKNGREHVGLVQRREKRIQLRLLSEF